MTICTTDEPAAGEEAYRDGWLQLPPTPPAPSFDGTQLCAQVDPELFFPENGSARSTRSAKKLCGGCEFLNPCRRYGMTERINGRPIFGVWGGTSETDRRALRLAAAGGALDVDEDLDDGDVDENVAS